MVLHKVSGFKMNGGNNELEAKRCKKAEDCCIKHREPFDSVISSKVSQNGYLAWQPGLTPNSTNTAD